MYLVPEYIRSMDNDRFCDCFIRATSKAAEGQKSWEWEEFGEDIETTLGWPQRCSDGPLNTSGGASKEDT